jgi:phosphatidylglycerophosphate synthase
METIANRDHPPPPRTWDGRLARRLVTPLADSAITPNHLTTVRLVLGLAGAACLALGGYRIVNIGAFLMALSNFVDHTDGELARISGKSSRIGHLYDLACDVLVTVLLFTSLGFGAPTQTALLPPVVLGLVSGSAVATIFLVRIQIEALVGKRGVAQSFAAGFETEDVLYLLPVVTLFDVAAPFLVVATIGSLIYLVWILIDYARTVRRPADDLLTTR